MIRVQITNEILNRILEIERNRLSMESVPVLTSEKNRLRTISAKKSAYSSNKIEGNPLTEEQANRAIEADPHQHFLKPETEIRNYFMAIEFLNRKLEANIPYSTDLLLQIQSIMEKGAPAEKRGLRGPTPPGVLFAVYDSQSGEAEYIPPEYCDIPELLAELEDYVNQTDDHPLLIAAVVHYQLVTIHPFEDGNGRTARLLSNYILESRGYHFNGIGSLEEYFAYDPQEYYDSLQMGLPALYYSGRIDPPHPEIWLNYILRMVALYSEGVCRIAKEHADTVSFPGLIFLKKGERELLRYLLENRCDSFTPVMIGKALGVTNKTIINRCVALTENGFITPVIGKERIRHYNVTEIIRTNREILLRSLIEKDALA